MADRDSINSASADDAPNVFTAEEYEQARKEYNMTKQRFDHSPANQQLLTSFDIFAFVMNRTIGSGIFTVPPKVLAGTGSVGSSLMLWFSGGVIMLCASISWLELGLTIPMHRVVDSDGETRTVSAPRNGGEKNYLEYIFKRPEFLMTAVFGILFIVLGNLAGNSVAFGMYFMIAIGRDPVHNNASNYEKGPVLALAIIVLTVCVLIHIITRKGAIRINRAFAVMKIGILLTITILGFVHAGGKYLKSSGINEQPTPGLNAGVANITSAMVNNAAKTNFDVNTSFSTRWLNIGSFVQSFTYAIYPYTGFEQPFYVMSEVENPKKIFPRSTIFAMLTTLVLYMLVNISYFCVVPKETYTSTAANSIDMAGAFFHDLFDSTAGPHTAQRAMAALIAFSIFGNILVLTFTAARVKQEIAKEGILPKSLALATGYTTLWARFRRGGGGGGADRPRPGLDDDDDAYGDEREVEREAEHTPIPALLLHWFTSVLLVVVTAMLKPATAYSFLVALYSYVNVGVLGVLTGGGLLYLKADWAVRGRAGRRWGDKVNYRPPLDPLPAVVYFLGMAFLVFAAFAKPPADSPYAQTATGYAWILVPAIGLTTLLWGVGWWSGLEVFKWQGRWKLEVTRKAVLAVDAEGNYVQKVERVQHEWLVVAGRHDDPEDQAYPMDDIRVGSK